MRAGYADEDPAVRDVLGAVQELTAGLRERAAEAERLCRLPEESVKELTEAGFFRLLRPRAFGGLAAPPQAHFAAVGALAAACGSTGWVASVFGVHAWHVSLFAPRTQREVWDPDAGALVSSSYAPSGTAVPVTGGYTLSGRWSFSSGCDHAQWVLLGAFVTGPEGSPPEMRAFLLSRDDYRVEAAWDTVGLRGTGSNDILVEDVFVPARRTIGVGASAERVFPGWESNPEPLYRVPFPAMFTTAVTAPIVGTAAGAYRDHCATLRDRIAEGRPRRGDLDPAGQLRIARGSGDVDASWSQLVGNMAELYDRAERAREPGLELRARTRRDQVLATERAVAAVDLLMVHAGGNAMRTGSGALQRAWRDVHTGRGHAANDIERGLLPYAQQALGLDVRESMV
ncbi:3-hydroxy-9,10-secoandrosta-1,3,5(10)-triene-9,17-dione monooxygenase [Streptomyces sp. cf386]|uniref:3-hydroxy-9,10-secoandrosta-1,3,5(10)-triene-9, 17-dione monooxygenase oxygenase subunit n=1 Tax=Streptomyces sp. cf386 TaxID=1761904 RepID=UPI000890F414|nr:3-hydroxy-9,10-secoandrosta-1,3,5(10)-triene-9,17-dione monooxygenase oxygenase subunit [Streptomyces sp. cf386]SDP01681.1 3-hydroxy-9,10-secoandrosta-1,3,5(10)-triene-9,17-dione monooxygenase [Streptomyces sp. cf386]